MVICFIANGAISPSGKKQMATKMVHAGGPASITDSLHPGQRVNAIKHQLWNVWPQLAQTDGFLPARRASNPKGKKQIHTKMTQPGYPPCWVFVEHFGQETSAMMWLLEVPQWRDC
jgi:hypothetical protein